MTGSPAARHTEEPDRPYVPPECGLAGFSTWSLAKLRDYLLAEGIVAELSREPLRLILRAGGVSWQTTTTWKASTDPDFIVKMRRILDLYDHRPPTAGSSAWTSSGR